jgi:hypothetical protein
MRTPRDNEGYVEEDDIDEEDDDCTCDIDGQENCPVHYPIDDGSDDDEE